MPYYLVCFTHQSHSLPSAATTAWHAIDPLLWCVIDVIALLLFFFISRKVRT